MQPERFAPISLRPVGVVRSVRTDRGDRDWGEVVCHIELDPERFDAEALRGLDSFTHAEVVFFLHGIPEAAEVLGSRHPRDDPAWPRLGIFAQRGASRPNRIGVSRARILGVAGRVVELQGLDAVDGTPVLDIKPWMSEFGPRGESRQPRWCAEVMAGYY